MAIPAGTNNVVIAGSWNAAIFNPTWVSANLASSKDAKITLGVPIGNPDAPMRLSFDNIELFPSSSRLEIRPVEQTLEGIQKAAAVGRKTLELLTHTPIVAAGVNFICDEEREADRIADGLHLEDEALFQTNGYDKKFTAVSRTFPAADSDLTLRISYPIKSANIEEATRFEFNYNHNVDTAIACVETMNEAWIASCYERTCQILNDVYHIAIEERAA